MLHHKEGGIDARPECAGPVNSLTSPTPNRTPILHLYLISRGPEYGTHPRGKGGRFPVPIWEQWKFRAKDHQETMCPERMRALQKAKIKGRRFLAPLALSLRIYSNPNSLADLFVALQCDGGTPVCATCTAVYKTECYYDAESENRRSKAAQKRDSASMAEPSAAADIIIASIRTLPESEVQEIVQQIRKDDSLDALAESLRKIVTLPLKSDGQGSLEGDLSVLIGKPQVSQSGVARHYGHTSSLGLVHEDENYSKPRNTSPISSNQDAWTTVTNDVQFLYHLFDLYFRWSHPFYVLFSRECFYKDFKSGRQKYCSPLLVNAICAYACHFSDTPAARTDPNNPRTAGDHFFAEARKLLYEDESPCLTTVQALAVMGLREPSAGRDSTGFMYAGRCLRMAVELGLHLNYSSTANLDLSRSEIEVRKVTFWGCFTYDTWVLHNSLLHTLSIYGS